MIACLIRYQLDPFKSKAFQAYAAQWGTIIPRCGGDLLGYFMPHEGTNDVAWALIGFADLAAYETYRMRLRQDPQGRANLAFAQRERCILREQRSFVAGVEGTLNRPSELPQHAPG